MTPNKEERERGRETTPPRLPDTTPQSFPSGDYSYVLEIVMNMQSTMGKLSEAIDSMKSQAKTHGEKIENIGKDIPAAKVVMGVIGGIVALVGAFLGWTINTAVQYFLNHPSK